MPENIKYSLMYSSKKFDINKYDLDNLVTLYNNYTILSIS